MGLMRRSGTRRSVVAAGAIAAHALIFWLWAQTDSAPGKDTPAFVGVWLLPAPAPSVDAKPIARTAPDAMRPHRRPPDLAPGPVDPGQNPSMSDAAQAPPAIEWSDAATAAAEHAATRSDRPDASSFTPPPSRRKRCPRQPSDTEWKAEPKQYGFAGGLPFVRLGKRCVLGLGFFGCALGDPPPANIHLLNGRDPATESDSSVPDVEGCAAVPATSEVPHR